MTNKRSQYGGLPLSAICAIVVAIIGVAVFLYMMILGGGKEFANASDAGALNVAKVALRAPFLKLNEVADVQVGGKTYSAAKLFRGLGDGAAKDEINLRNINGIWRHALVAGLNYSAMANQAAATPAALSNAQAMCQLASAMSTTLRQRLTNADGLKTAFTDYCKQNSTRMLGNDSSNVQIIDGWQVAYVDRGGASNVQFDPTQIPEGLPQTALNAINGARDGNGFIRGYQEIVVDPTNNLRYYFTTLPGNSRPHLVSQSTFNSSTGIPEQDSRPYVPNTFQVMAQMLIKEGAKDGKEAEARMTNVASFGQSGPMDVLKPSPSSFFIRIANRPGQGTPGTDISQAVKPANYALDQVPPNGYHAIEWANAQLLGARSNGAPPANLNDGDSFTTAMKDPPFLINDPDVPGKSMRNSNDTAFSYGNTSDITDTYESVLQKGAMPSGLKDSNGDFTADCLIVGLNHNDTRIAAAFPDSGSSGSGSTSSVPRKKHLASKRHAGITAQPHTSTTGSSGTSGTTGDSGTSGTSGSDSEAAAAAEAAAANLLKRFFEDAQGNLSGKKIDTDTISETSKTDPVVKQWVGETYGKGYLHLDQMEFGSRSHPHLWTMAPGIKAGTVYQNNKALQFDGIQSTSGYESDAHELFKYAFSNGLGIELFSGMEEVGQNRPPENSSKSVLFAKSTTVRVMLYPENTGVAYSPAGIMAAYSYPEVNQKLFGNGSLGNPEANSELGLLKAIRERMVTRIKQMDPDQFKTWTDADLRNFLTGVNNPTLPMGEDAYIFLNQEGKLVCRAASQVATENADIAASIVELGNTKNGVGLLVATDGRPIGEKIDATSVRANNPFDKDRNTIAYVGPRYPAKDGMYLVGGDWGYNPVFTNNATGASGLGDGGATDVRHWYFYVMAPCSGSGGMLAECVLGEFFNQPDTLRGAGGDQDPRLPPPCDLIAGVNHGCRPLDCPCECYPDMALINSLGSNYVTPDKFQSAIAAGTKKIDRAVRHAGINAQPHTNVTDTNTAATCKSNCSHSGPC
jgi:hypothetical protein